MSTDETGYASVHLQSQMQLRQQYLVGVLALGGARIGDRASSVFAISTDSDAATSGSCRCKLGLEHCAVAALSACGAKCVGAEHTDALHI